MEQSRKEKEVWQACDALESENDKLTYKAIGDKLIEMGCCRGSNSDICRYLTTWRQYKGYGEPDTAYRAPSTTQLLPPTQKDLWPVLEQIQQHLRQLDDKVERLSKQKADQATSAKVSKASTTQQDWLKDALSNPTNAYVMHSDLERFTDSQAKAFLKLFEHHEMLFDKYLSSLESLRTANARLTKKLAEYESAAINAHDEN